MEQQIAVDQHGDAVREQSGELPVMFGHRLRNGSDCPATYRQPCWFRDEIHHLRRYAWRRTVPQPQSHAQDGNEHRNQRNVAGIR